MEEILITGNGIFLKKNQSLSAESINKRFRENFKLFSDEIIGTQKFRFQNIRDLLKPWNLVSLNDGFIKLFDKFYEDFINIGVSDNYEVLFGNFINSFIQYLEMKSNFHKREKLSGVFKEVYSKLVNIIQSILFMDLPEERPSQMTYPKFGSHFIHYTLNILIQPEFDFYLHGQYDLKKWSYDIDEELMAAAGSEDEQKQVLLAENVSEWPLAFDVPMIFGNGISQKVKVLKMLKGYKDTDNKRINAAFERKIPYIRLTKDSEGKNVHIFGVSVDTHKELIEHLTSANKIYWYWYSEEDLNELKKIKSNKLVFKKFDQFPYGA